MDIDLINNYNKFGFIKLNNIYSSQEIDEILHYIDSLNYSDYSYTLDEFKKPLRIEYFIKKNEELLNKIIKKPWYNLVKKLFKTDEICLFKDKFICKNSGSSEVLPPHVDGLYHFYNHRLNKETFGWYTYANVFAQVGIYLTDNTKENGCLYIDNKKSDDINYLYEHYVDKSGYGSYIIKDKMIEESIYDNGNCLEGKKGDIIIFNPKCIHWSNSNNTSSNRKNLYLAFNSIEYGDNYELTKIDKELSLEHMGQDEITFRTKKY
jgi:hypothetical protein